MNNGAVSEIRHPLFVDSSSNFRNYKEVSLSIGLISKKHISVKVEKEEESKSLIIKKCLIRIINIVSQKKSTRKKKSKEEKI